jgi:membrane-associated phospholipid phosphatase
MSKQREPFWHWPGWRRLALVLCLSLLVGAWFELIYGGADWLTSRHDFRVRVHLGAELDMPFVPAAVLGYLSIYCLFAMPVFVLRTSRELCALAAMLVVVILCAGIGFLLVPAEAAFPPAGEMGRWAPLVRFAKTVALTNNFIPSLHVALSVALVVVFARRAGPLGKALLTLWGSVIALSTPLLHQHYLLDVVTGAVLGWAGVYCIYDRLIPPLSP